MYQNFSSDEFGDFKDKENWALHYIYLAIMCFSMLSNLFELLTTSLDLTLLGDCVLNVLAVYWLIAKKRQIMLWLKFLIGLDVLTVALLILGLFVDPSLILSVYEVDSTEAIAMIVGHLIAITFLWVLLKFYQKNSDSLN